MYQALRNYRIFTSHIIICKTKVHIWQIHHLFAALCVLQTYSRALRFCYAWQYLCCMLRCYSWASRRVYVYVYGVAANGCCSAVKWKCVCGGWKFIRYTRVAWTRKRVGALNGYGWMVEETGHLFLSLLVEGITGGACAKRKTHRYDRPTMRLC